MNNKGFAATGMLFIVLLLFLALYVSLLSMFANRRKIYETIKDEIVSSDRTGSIVLNKTSATIEIGGTVKLEAEVNSDTQVDKNIIWRSSDEAIATIDSSGVVRGISKGKVIITAKTSNNMVAKSAITVYNKANYGTSISSSYNNIYIRNSETSEQITKTHNYDNVYSGNYSYPHSLKDKINQLDNATTLSAQRPLSGSNTFNLSQTSQNKWILFYIHAGASTTGILISNVKLNFVDNSSLTLKQSVTNGYIEPLVISSAGSHSSSYVWNNFYNLIDGGSTDVANYPGGIILFKVKDKSALKSIQMNSNKDFASSYNDGINIYEYQNINLSTSPFE